MLQHHPNSYTKHSFNADGASHDQYVCVHHTGIQYTISFVQEAFDIFGDVGELLAMYDARKTTDADDLEAEQEPDFSDEEAAETFRIEQVSDRV